MLHSCNFTPNRTFRVNQFSSLFCLETWVHSWSLFGRWSSFSWFLPFFLFPKFKHIVTYTLVISFLEICYLCMWCSTRHSLKYLLVMLLTFLLVAWKCKVTSKLGEDFTTTMFLSLHGDCFVGRRFSKSKLNSQSLSSLIFRRKTFLFVYK